MASAKVLLIITRQQPHKYVSVLEHYIDTDNSTTTINKRTLYKANLNNPYRFQQGKKEDTQLLKHL